MTCAHASAERVTVDLLVGLRADRAGALANHAVATIDDDDPEARLAVIRQQFELCSIESSLPALEEAWEASGT